MTYREVSKGLRIAGKRNSVMVTAGTKDMPKKKMRFLNKYDGRSGGGCCVASPSFEKAEMKMEESIQCAKEKTQSAAE